MQFLVRVILGADEFCKTSLEKMQGVFKCNRENVHSLDHVFFIFDIKLGNIRDCGRAVATLRLKRIGKPKLNKISRCLHQIG